MSDRRRAADGRNPSDEEPAGLDRRELIAGGLAAGLAAALPAAASPAPAQGGERSSSRGKRAFEVKVVSSYNGLEATRLAHRKIVAGADVLDAVIAGVNLVEDDPDDLTVGLGGLPNEDGVVELDAAVMHGPTHRAGAVASLRGIQNPSLVARKVMEETDHVLLVGEGALRFARAHGFEERDLLTDKARKIWLYWKQSLSEKDDWVPPPVGELDPAVRERFDLEDYAADPATDPAAPAAESRPTGTIHCSGIDAAGHVSCVTTTSGLAFKIPGRVGDSPIVGAGLYAENGVGTCGSTGRGEANLQNLCSYAAVELMRGGMAPKDAGLEVLRRVSATSEPRLRDEQGRPSFGLKFYLMHGASGEHAGVSMWGPAQYAVTDESGTRHEDCAVLYEREPDG